MTALSEYLVEVAHQQGIDNASAFARRVGVAYETGRRLWQGIGNPEPETLARIADRFGVPLRRLRELAKLPPDEPAPFTLPPEFAFLDEEHRRLLVRVGWKLLQAQQAAVPTEPPAERGTAATVTAIGTDGGPQRERVKRAARRRPPETH